MMASMKRLLLLLPLFLLGAEAGAADRSPAGSYRLVGEQDVASGLRLQPGGRFQYFLSAGALDEQAQGRWSVAGGVVTLITEPAPVPPVFEAARSTRTAEAALTVKVSSPSGDGIAGVDLRIGFDEGDPVADYTQEYGWSLPADEKRVPRWIELTVPMHGIVSPRFPIDLAAGNALAFTLVPNDLGVLDFGGIRVEVAKKALIVHRGGAALRYEAVKAR
ncbi:MAG: hypothetical protein QOJ91_1837 [Sphingomonadales bacterium]|jgi:hypothetical protein|nr:hypothetical protein [Sphingomonadales bacterium]